MRPVTTTCVLASGICCALALGPSAAFFAMLAMPLHFALYH